MRVVISTIVSLVIVSLVSPVLAAGMLTLDIPGLSPGKLKAVAVEVWRVDGKQPEVVYQDNARKISKKGIRLSAGTYTVYLEDESTGLILTLDNEGAGYEMADGQAVAVVVSDLVTKVKKIKAKDKAERKSVEEQRKQGKGRGHIFAVGTGGGEGREEEYAPGELLIKYAPGTTLADRYRFLQELSAEARSKLQALEVYRVKVDEATNLKQLIQTYADDPRLSYMEMNMVVSIPEPIVEEDTRR